MIDQEQLKRLNAGAEKVQSAVDNGNFLKATDLWRDLEMDIFSETNNIDFYNILYKVKPNSMSKSNGCKCLSINN